MSLVTMLVVKYGSKIVAASVILLVRHMEKSKIVKHYKNKLDNILRYGKD